jgi:hypothetical protein
VNYRDKVIRWLLSDDTGVSSKALCACFCGISSTDKFDNYPRDPSDFGRCKRFLEILTPEDKNKVLQKAAGLSVEWKALAGKWDLLEKMYNGRDSNLYQQMRKIIGGAK